MAVKTSIFQIDLRDDSFNAFVKKYNAYEKSLKSMPAAWAAVNDKIKGSRSSFDALVDGMVAANVQAKLRAKAEERADRLSQTTAERWGMMARHAKSFASDVGRATTSLLRWGALTGLISGLLGAGGLFGIDRLALSVSAGRRSSLGLGVGYGEQRSFGANFGRLVDPDQFLSAVSAAQLDVTKRVGLIGGGLTQQQIGGSAATASVALLRNLKRIADTTDPSLYAQVLQSRRLDQFASPEDLRRLRGTSRGEFESLVQSYGRNRGAFDLPPDIARRWQEFTTQMARAGQGIENTFVRGLAPLAPGLTKLSESFEKVVRAFLGSPALEKWIKQVDVGLEKFAGYIGTDEFARNVASFIKGVGDLAAGVGNILRFFGIGGAADTSPAVSSQQGLSGRTGNPNVPASPGQARFNGWMNYITGARPGNNPGNLRPPGSSTGFAVYPNADAGIIAMAHQLQLYARRDHLDTIQGIVSKYAPPNENDTRAYVGDVARKTGYGAGQHLDLNDPNTLSKLIAAMVSHEQSRGHYDKYKDAKVVVEVLNNTGGNANVTVNGLKN